MKLLNKQDLDKLVEEPFEKFLSRLDLRCPEPVDAIPVEWIKHYKSIYGLTYSTLYTLLGTMLEDWRKENE